MKKLYTILMLSLISTATLITNTSYACTRFTYTPSENSVIVGRSMDWVEDLHTELWAFPAGMKRTGSAGTNSITWTSKYGSLIASGYNIGAADGINTKGLDANLLYLSDSNYGAPNPNHKNLSVLNWLQYVLDNYATVNEAVQSLQKAKLNIIAPLLPNGEPAVLHLAITDPSGDNAIFEYVNGKLVIHHGKQYTVMTNEPTYDQQLALNDYWQSQKGKFLPGTSNPADRFVRTSYYLQTAPRTANQQEAIATAFSIIRNVSVPMGVQTPGQPNVAATLWRSVADITHKIYYFDPSNRPNVFWVDMSKLNLQAGAPVKKLAMANNQIYAGEVSKYFINSTPFISPEVKPNS